MLPLRGNSQRTPMGLGIPQQIGDEEDYSLYSLKNISFEDNRKTLL